jgi:DNA-binding LacI/PurR family transcriptional regulator
MVNGTTDDRDVPQIVSGDEEGGNQAAAYLYGLGHRRICVIAGPQEHRSHNLRLRGFRSSLKQRDCPVEEHSILYSPQSTFEEGYRLMSGNWQQFRMQGYTALFATNDMLALGAMRFLLQKSVRIPEQVAVMGFDDIDIAAMYSPSLTTMKVDKLGMGSDAVKILDRLIRQESVPPAGNEHATALVIREST